MNKRVIMLQSIFEHFQQITQWLPDNLKIAIEHAYKAETIIELLEIADCGSHGGFDTNNPLWNKTSYPLYNRFLTICKKHKDLGNIKNCCGFTPESLGLYFTKVSLMRDTMLQGQEDDKK